MLETHRYDVIVQARASVTVCVRFRAPLTFAYMYMQSIVRSYRAHSFNTHHPDARARSIARELHISTRRGKFIITKTYNIVGHYEPSFSIFFATFAHLCQQSVRE